jgi:hypothetical protein
MCPKPRKLQENTGKPFLAVIEKQIAKIFFEVDVARQQQGREFFGKLGLPVSNKFAATRNLHSHGYTRQSGHLCQVRLLPQFCDTAGRSIRHHCCPR